MRMQTCTILINENAGLHRDTATPDQLRELADKLQLEVEVVETKSEEHLCETIRSLMASGAECIGVAGGDGTIHAAVQCVACSETVLAIIPQGTRNNFAHAL